MVRKRRKINLNERQVQEVENVLKEKKKVSFDEATKRFLDNCEAKGLSEHTISYYDKEFRMIRRHLVEFTGTDLADIRNISPEDIQEMISTYLGMGRRKNAINTRLRAVRALFNWAVRKRLLTISPMEEVGLLRVQHEVGDTFTKKQLERILTAPNTDTFVGMRDLALLRTFSDTGARLLEITSLTVQSLNFEESVIIFSRTKNGNVRRIPMSKTLERTLKTWLKIRGLDIETNSLFITEFDTPLTSRQIQNRMKYYGKETKLENEVTCSPHTFRRSFAKRLIQNKVDIFTVQALMGHSSLEVLKKYVALYSEDLKKGIETGL